VTTKTQRILSFDGGGIRGVFQSSFLSCLDDLPLVPQADLLAGTSTGAIIATALALGILPKKLVEIYESLGKKIFNKKARWFRRHLMGDASYSSDTLKAQLEEHLPKVKFGECAKRVLIPAVSLNSWSPYIFDSSNPQDGSLSVVDVLLATTAAPTYFKPHFINEERTTWVDGGLVCNNPSFEALHKLNKAPASIENIRVLSIGNGKHPATHLPSSFMQKRPLRWALDVTEICMNATSDESHIHCDQLLRKEHYIRINTFLGEKIALDDYAKALEILPALARKEANENRQKIIEWLE
jgi:patatin-like phospholipase/acyl hydrolase